MSMMGAACQMTGKAVLQRLFGGQQRAADGTHGAPGQGLVPGQAQAALVFARQFAVHVAGDVGRVVGQGEDVVGADLRAQQCLLGGQAAVDQVIVEQAELVHREAVLGWKRRAVVVVVDQGQGHDGFKQGLLTGSCQLRPAACQRLHSIAANRSV
ncbi:hypothetical protein D3C81_1684140 [compost metagenome]